MGTTEIIFSVITVFYLIIFSIGDLINKKINIAILAGYFFICVSFTICLEIDLKSVMLGMATGAILLIISLITKGQIGLADAVLLISIGMVSGAGNSIMILSWSLLFAAIVSGFLLVVLKKGRKSVLPFIPFMLVGYVFTMFV